MVKEANNLGAQGLAASGSTHWTRGPVTPCKKPGFCDLSPSRSEGGFIKAFLSSTSQTGLLRPWIDSSEVHMLETVFEKPNLGFSTPAPHSSPPTRSDRGLSHQVFTLDWSHSSPVTLDSSTQQHPLLAVTTLRYNEKVMIQ